MKDLSVIGSAFLLDMPVDSRLEPFLENRPAGLLPVKGKPAIQYWCEQLNQLGVANVTVVSRHFPEQLRDFLGNGKRWGLSVEVLTVPDSASVRDLLKFIQPKLSGRALVASISNLPKQSLVELESANFAVVQELTDQSLQVGFSSACLLEADHVSAYFAGQTGKISCAIKDAFNSLRTPLELWQANMDAIHGRIYDPLPSGFEGEKGLLTDIGVQIRPGFRLVAPVSLGRNSMLAQRVFVGPDVIIGNDCMVEEQSQIRESVIFDHTFIGSHSDLRRVMVDGSLVFQVDNDLATWIDDQAIIGTTIIRRSSVSYLERLIAVILLLLATPVMILHALVSLFSGRHVVKREMLYMPSGRDLTGQVIYNAIEVVSLQLSHPLWRKLPWLVQVVLGKMHLVGISPLNNEKVEYPLWAKALIGLKPGVVNLQDVEENIGVENEQFIKDNYFIVTKSFKNSIILFWRWTRNLFVFDVPRE
jgi:NDP-sugar pyrophosphorylase family protein